MRNYEVWLEGNMAILSWPIITLPSISLVLIIFFLSICLENDINIKQEVEKISRYEPSNSSFLINYMK